MISRNLLKQEIEKVGEECLEVLYKIIKVFESQKIIEKQKDWIDFVEKSYGSLSDDPIKHHKLSGYENRLSLK